MAQPAGRSRADHWNMTGDIYRRDEDGYFWFVARTDDMIISGGHNIAGPEVESALALHPAVEDCAVIGWPDSERGQIHCTSHYLTCDAHATIIATCLK
jgi:acyl-coenzyme A synthetase/AMP-(fatty) acid ligase